MADTIARLSPEEFATFTAEVALLRRDLAAARLLYERYKAIEDAYNTVVRASYDGWDDQWKEGGGYELMDEFEEVADLLASVAGTSVW